ncbi:hypothetical protein IC582_001321 [Cucumis melo]|uniref:Zinc finger protein ZAT3 n=2 Tax=Cucumis melo TaxID=3656 RepID=A0A5D3DIU1_CUCMM|nr:zinc finger protein ZAT3 [Cucumis melo var. makuwa]
MNNPHFNSLSVTSTSSSPIDLITIPFQPSTSSFDSSNRRRPRKKRSRTQTDDDHYSTTVLTTSKSKYTKKPDPNAPKITRPCTECGKKFWSDKALFGHMRCHPERQWRGIIPPVNYRRPISVSPNFSPNLEHSSNSFTEEDQDIANSLLMLANGPNFSISRVSDSRFECSSCKKVFGSHQALGGHRASHKNVRGCFAMAKSDEEETEDEITLFGDFGRHESSFNLENKMSMMILETDQNHKKRFQWENNAATDQERFVNLDLNLPAPLEDDSSSSYSSSLTLDLRLGL